MDYALYDYLSSLWSLLLCYNSFKIQQLLVDQESEISLSSVALCTLLSQHVCLKQSKYNGFCYRSDLNTVLHRYFKYCAPFAGEVYLFKLVKCHETVP